MSVSDPIVTHLRLFADADGESHFESEVFESGSGDRLQVREGSARHYSIRVVPAGWVRDWGPSEQPTLAVYLSGEGTVEASDGDWRRVSPGVILLAEDTTGRGHRAEVGRHQPLVVMHVTLPPLRHRPRQSGYATPPPTDPP